MLVFQCERLRLRSFVAHIVHTLRDRARTEILQIIFTFIVFLIIVIISPMTEKVDSSPFAENVEALIELTQLGLSFL